MNIISYKFRLYPTKEQEQYFAKCFGSTRFLWNKMLENRINYYKENGESLYDTPTSYKKTYTFLGEIDSLALCNVQLDLNKAYKSFFKSNFGFPKFKSKRVHKDSYTTNNVNNSIRIEGNKIKLPKIGWIKIKVHRKLEGTIKNATISKDNVGNYYISLTCETSKNFILGKVNSIVGIDLGIKDLYTDSNGNKISNPKYHQKSLKKIKKLQKNLSRKHKGSNNYEKARLKLAKTNLKVSNQRKDYLHKESKKLINDNQVICLESLSINEICSSKKSNSNFRRASYDAGLGMFISMLVYKAKLYGRTIKVVDKYFPSSQVCSSCGELHPEMKNLNNRTLVCKDCGTVLDRDTNAAINILNNAK